MKLCDGMFYSFFVCFQCLFCQITLFCFFLCPATEDELPMVLDGYDLYLYMTVDNEEWVHDHFIFHMKPNLEFTVKCELMIGK